MALRLSRTSYALLAVWISWMTLSCAPLPPYGAYAAPVAFLAISDDGHCSSSQNDCPKLLPDRYRAEHDAALREIVRVVKNLQDTQNGNINRIATSLDGLRHGLERFAPCDSVAKCPGIESDGLTRDVRVIGLEEQISRVIGAIDSMRGRGRECCGSDVKDLREAQKELSDTTQGLAKRVETLEKTIKDSEVSKNKWLIALVVFFFTLAGAMIGGLGISAYMNRIFSQSNNPFPGDDVEVLKGRSNEIVEGYRHYSNLRFAVFTLFVAMSGALGALNFGKDYQEMTKDLHPVLPLGGILLTIAFAIMEFVIDLNQTEYYYMARALRNSPTREAIALGVRHPTVSHWNQKVRFPIWGILGLVIGVWTAVIIFS